MSACRYRFLSFRSRSSLPGFVVAAVLIFLLLISVLAIGVSQHSLLQQRMAGSLRHAQQAGLSAETALRAAEYRIWSAATQTGGALHCQEESISADDGCIVYRPGTAPYAANGAVTQFQRAGGRVPGIGKSYAGPLQHGYTHDSDEASAELAANPAYLIEDLGSQRPPGAGVLHESGNTGPGNGIDQIDVHIYRITARGTGGNPNMVRVLQSTFSAPAGS